MAKPSAATHTREEKVRPEVSTVRGLSGRQASQAMAELDRTIHERLRLSIVSTLAVHESLSFNNLKKLLNTTDGNLSVHARKLEEAKYITSRKYFQGRLPKTEYRLTEAGRCALERYLNHMEALIQAVRKR